MGFNINDIGKQIVNPIVGLFINDKSIPLGSKGEVRSIEYETEKIYVKWLIEDKSVSTSFTFTQFEQLSKSGTLLEVSDYEEPPVPKYEVGDILEGICVIGVVKSRKFDGVNNVWLYTLYQLDGLFSDDYILRYDTSSENELTKLKDGLSIDIDYYNNKKFELKIKEKN